MKKIFISLLLTFIVHSAFCAHLPLGGQISIEHDTLNQYFITLKLYKKCGGVGLKDSQQVQIASSSKSLNRIKTITKTDSFFSYTCEATPCGVSAFGGMEISIYTDTLTLDSVAHDWVFSYLQCCRNNIQNLSTPNARNLYFETILDNTSFLENSSPIDYTFQREYYCVNNHLDLDLGLVDFDGDSLDYQLVNALDSSGIPMVYSSPFTFSNPLANTICALNHQTGAMQLTATSTGEYLIAYAVREYRNNQLISTTYKDFVVRIVACTFFPPGPFFSYPSLSGVNGSTIDTVSACYDVGFNFLINSSDVNPNDSVKLYALIKPNGSMINVNVSQFQSANFVWNTAQFDTSAIPYILIAQASDRSCAVRYKVFKLFVKPCTALAKKNVLNQTKINVYPNPTTSNMTIALNFDKAQHCEIILYDLVGRVVDAHVLMENFLAVHIV